MPEKEKFNILVAGSDEGPKVEISRSLSNLGYAVEQARSGDEVLYNARTTFERATIKRARQLKGPEYFINNVIREALANAKKSHSNYDFSHLDLVILDAKLPELNAVLSTIKENDEYLPVLATGPEDTELASRAVKLGVFNYVNNPKENLNKILTHVKERLTLSVNVGKVTVIKYGGSLFDQDDDNEITYKNLEVVLECCAGYVNSKKGGLIMTVGGGRLGDIQKRFNAKYHKKVDVLEGHFHKQMRACIELNVRNICDTFNDGGIAQYISPDDFVRVSDELLQKKIVVIPFAPVPIHRRHGISFGDSDVETIASTAFYEAEELIIIKDTDAVYWRDPLFGSQYGETRWMELQRTNQRLRQISAKELLNVDRRGAFDGHPDHLLETNAIKYWLEHAPKLKAIYLVPIAPEKMFIKDSGSFADNSLRLRHVIDGLMEFQPLKEKLSAALNGEGYKITRE